jgi:hypothetical protein
MFLTARLQQSVRWIFVFDHHAPAAIVHAPKSAAFDDRQKFILSLVCVDRIVNFKVLWIANVR